MDLMNDINWKSLIIGAAITAAIIIIASNGYEWLYLFSAIGIIYVGYMAKNIKFFQRIFLNRNWNNQFSSNYSSCRCIYRICWCMG